VDAFPPSIERNDFDAILSHLLEGVIVVDGGGRVVWINPAAEAFIGLRSNGVSGRPACEVFEQPELRDIFSRGTPIEPGRGEIGMADGHTFYLRITPLREGRVAVIFQQITPSTMNEHTKREYTSFIAHELRSPLTAILGYAELIALATPVTPRQADFIRQIQASVRKINDFIGGISL
jgi:two-component system, OmpR family, phosphate regulon sensor histidine kinase PhoR